MNPEKCIWRQFKLGKHIIKIGYAWNRLLEKKSSILFKNQIDHADNNHRKFCKTVEGQDNPLIPNGQIKHFQNIGCAYVMSYDTEI